MARTRDGAHYATNKMYRPARTRPCFTARDAAYRAALGLVDGEPIPMALGLTGRNSVPDDAEEIM